jgi:hypothetical protein
MLEGSGSENAMSFGEVDLAVVVLRRAQKDELERAASKIGPSTSAVRA